MFYKNTDATTKEELRRIQVANKFISENMDSIDNSMKIKIHSYIFEKETTIYDLKKGVANV